MLDVNDILSYAIFVNETVLFHRTLFSSISWIITALTETKEKKVLYCCYINI